LIYLFNKVYNIGSEGSKKLRLKFKKSKEAGWLMVMINKKKKSVYLKG